MRSLVGDEEDLTGWCNLTDILRFRRAADLVVSEDNAIDAATRCLAGSTLVEVADGKIRRRTPVAVEDSTLGFRTVYVEPIGNANLDAVRAVFERVGKVDLVRIPKRGDQYRPFAFVEYADQDAARQACATFDGASLFDNVVSRVITRFEWAALRTRWNDLLNNPIASTRRASKTTRKTNSNDSAGVARCHKRPRLAAPAPSPQPI
ncbi:hypothetical protein CTAYLR_001991 [Chrysophaeum taylorii]|uniref:RRM domain-containing protein n=1 Tax=Chrysophaeum taylorii TaxID=2483200 RepID=A0AAD7UAK7_9STRA|nr:hypothetical protein CTAYLR_001991 [Chrysophaeum taylorii]